MNIFVSACGIRRALTNDHRNDIRNVSNLGKFDEQLDFGGLKGTRIYDDNA